MELSERDSTKIRDIARGYDVLCQDTIQIDVCHPPTAHSLTQHLLQELLNAAVPKAIELKGLSKEQFNLQINQFQQRDDLSVRAFEVRQLHSTFPASLYLPQPHCTSQPSTTQPCPRTPSNASIHLHHSLGAPPSTA